MTIHNILSSIPHNKHYLNRYIKYINTLNVSKKNNKTYSHHICPKSIFPEYKNLKKHKWNKISLTYKQHFIAHLLLCKIYPDNKGLIGALILINGNNKLLSAKQAQKYESIWSVANSEFHKNKSKYTYDGIKYTLLSTNHPDVISGAAVNFNKDKIPAIYSDGKTILLSKNHPNIISGIATTINARMGNYKDKDNNRYHLSITDPKIKELNLVGIQHNVVGPNKGKVLCKNKSTGEYIHLDKHIFDSSSEYVSVNAGRVPSINIKTQERKSLFKTDSLYSHPDWISLAKWRVSQ